LIHEKVGLKNAGSVEALLNVDQKEGFFGCKNTGNKLRENKI
jgi:hypothetical protein